MTDQFPFPTIEDFRAALRGETTANVADYAKRVGVTDGKASAAAFILEEWLEKQEGLLESTPMVHRFAEEFQLTAHEKEAMFTLAKTARTRSEYEDITALGRERRSFNKTYRTTVWGSHDRIKAFKAGESTETLVLSGRARTRVSEAGKTIDTSPGPGLQRPEDARVCHCCNGRGWLPSRR